MWTSHQHDNEEGHRQEGNQHTDSCLIQTGQEAMTMKDTPTLRTAAPQLEMLAAAQEQRLMMTIKRITKLQMDVRLLKRRVAMLEQLVMQHDDGVGDEAMQQPTVTGNVVRLLPHGRVQ